MTLAAASIMSDFTYVPDNNHTIAVFVAFIIFHGLVNSLNTRWLSEITRYYAFINIGSTFAAIIVLLVKQSDKNSAKFVFTEVVNSSGWSNQGFGFLFGFLSVSWVMTDYDATAHIAEEIKNPAIKAPIAIISALGTTYVLGWVLNLVMAFCMGTDINGLLTSTTALPAAQLYYNVLGKSGATAFMALSVIIGNFTGATALQAQSRTLYALSRDQMIPLSSVWVKINSITHTPIYAVWINVAFCIAITLIGLGSQEAILAIFNTCAIALDWSYCIPFLCKVIWPTRFHPGPVNAGKYGRYINMYAIAWTSFLSVVFVFPSTMPVTKETMNYVSVVLVGILFLSYVWWVLSAKKYYIGPRTNVEALILGGNIEEVKELRKIDEEIQQAVEMRHRKQTTT